MSINNFISTGWNSNGWKELKASFYREESKSKFKITSKSGRLCCLAAIPLHLVEFLGVKSIVYGGAAGVCALKSVVQLGKAASRLCCGKEDAGLHLNKSKKQIIKAGGYVTSAIAAPFGQIARTVKAGAGVFHPGAYFKSNLDIINMFDSDVESDTSDITESDVESDVNNEPELQLVDAYFSEGNLFCDREQIKRNPRQALHKFAKNIRLIGKINFLNEPGNDAGGLTREFYTLVFAHLSKELNLNSGQKGMIQWSAENHEVLEDIGIIFAEACNLPYTRTGEVFHLDYFKAIHAFYHNTFDDDFNKMNDDALLKILEAITPPPPKESEALIKFYEFYNENKDKKIEEIDPSELKKLAKYIGFLSHIHGYNIPDLPSQLLEILKHVDLQKLDDTSDFDHILDRTKNELSLQGYTKDSLENDLNRLFNNLKKLHATITGERDEELDFAKPKLTVESRNRLQAIHTIVKSMKRRLNPTGREITQTATPADLSEIIQGKFTREDFIALVKKAQVEDQHRKIYEVINNWMDRQSDERLKAFLQAITGSTSLPYMIYINITPLNSYISTSTCGFSLQLNDQWAEGALDKALDVLVDNPEGFQNK